MSRVVHTLGVGVVVIALRSRQRRGERRDERPHLRRRGLHVDRDAVGLQRARADRAHGGDDRRAEMPPQRLGAAMARSDREQVLDLHQVGHLS